MKKKIVWMIFFILYGLLFVIAADEKLINVDNYLSSFEQKGISDTLKTIRILYEDGNLTSDQCHFLLHKLGSKSITIFGLEQSMRYATNLCRGGFIHGIFSTAKIKENTSENICSSHFFSLKSQLQCLHGLGHGLTITHNYNLSQALNSCNQQKKQNIKSACATGVFMEEFSPRAHPFTHSRYNPFETCKNNMFKDECYWYVALKITENKSLELGIKECEKLSRTDKINCERGFGVLSARRKNYDPNSIIYICQQLSSCISGVASEFGLSGEITKGISFCSKVSKKTTCFLEILNSYFII